MLHFEGIGFENFRVFKNQTYFSFAPITVLTGMNSSGKSSVINGIRLLAENFKNIKPEEKHDYKTLQLDPLLTKTLDISAITNRYGSLEQFLNYNSRKKEFKFSIVQQLPFLNDQIEINYTVKIEPNKLRSGRIKAIDVISISDKKTVFTIKEKEKELQIENGPFYYAFHLPGEGTPKEEPVKKTLYHTVQIDHSYFLSKYNDLIVRSSEYFQSRNEVAGKLKDGIDSDAVQEALKTHNNKFGDALEAFEHPDGSTSVGNFYGFPVNVISPSDVWEKLVSEHLNHHAPFDFSFLWKQDASEITEFLSFLNHHYGANESDLLSFQAQILNVLAEVEWSGASAFHPADKIDYMDTAGVDHFLKFSKLRDSDSAPPFSLKYFIEKYVFYDAALAEEPTEDEIRERIEYAIAQTGIKNSDFVERVFIPLLIRLSKVKKSRYNFEFDNQFYTLNNTEKYFYNRFIYDALEHIALPIQQLMKFTFIDASRIHAKRVFSINHDDNFSKQVKALLTVSDERYAECLNFLNKWIKEFNIADELVIQKDEDSDNFKIYLSKEGSKPVLLADYGYGISQVLPILLELIPIPNPSLTDPFDHSYLPKLICIEEPENSLHPALQSKLAEMFAEASRNFNVQLA